MGSALIMFSGLAGTGKSTLADAVARELKIPILSFDYFIDFVLPRHVLTNPGSWTNQDVFEMMNRLAEQQLSVGISVIMDAVYFTKESRHAVRVVAENHNARFCTIHTFCSDKDVWMKRVLKRVADSSPSETPAQWDTIMAEMDKFQPWDPDEALFVDSFHSVEVNLQEIKNYLLTSQD